MTIAENKFELVELLRRWIAGLRLEWVSASQIRILPGEAISDDYQELMVSKANIIVDITVAGVNGLDAGVEAANTWYYVWLIKDLDSGQVSGLISASLLPTLPSGYTKKRILGIVRNNAASNFLNFRMFAGGKYRIFFYQENISSTLLVLAGGNATVWTPVSLANLAPPTALPILNSWAQSQNAFFRQTGTTPITQTIIANCQLDFRMPIDGLSRIDYYTQTPAGRVYISVRGFCFEV